MTISTANSSITVAGTGSQSVFNFPFVADSASDITVVFTSTTGVQTTLSSSQYSVSINAAGVNQLWGIGGTVTYPISGTPIAVGTTLTISRVLPLTQETSVQNQGNYYAQVTEQALDTLEMQIQQINNVASEAIHFPVGDTANALLPSAALRANQALLFDSNGNATVGAPSSGGVPISAAMQPVVAASSIAAADALLGVTPVVFSAASVTGTANAIIIPSTLPGTFTLENGTILFFTPNTFNTATTTLAVTSTGVPYTVYKTGGAELVTLQAEDLTPLLPVALIFNTNINGLGTSGWIAFNILLEGRVNYLNSTYNTSQADMWQIFISTGAYNHVLPATSGLLPYFWEELRAQTGAITLVPNGTDTINGTNANFTLPQGASCKLITDAGGHWFTDFYQTSAAAGSQAFTSSGTFTTPATTTANTQFKFTLTGGGGGGGGTSAANNGGGGAGSTAIYYATGLSAGQTIAVTVGTGGAGGSNAGGNNGTNSSIVVGATTVTAPGGFAGFNNAAGGIGGGNCTNATINIPGGYGGLSYTSGNIIFSGFGGASMWGGGGAGVGNGTGSSNLPGINGQAPGSGGSGSTGTADAGGTGASGICLVEWK